MGPPKDDTDGITEERHFAGYSNLPNKRTGMNYRILRKNLDQGFMIIFDQ